VLTPDAIFNADDTYTLSCAMLSRAVGIYDFSNPDIFYASLHVTKDGVVYIHYSLKSNVYTVSKIDKIDDPYIAMIDPLDMTDPS